MVEKVIKKRPLKAVGAVKPALNKVQVSSAYFKSATVQVLVGPEKAEWFIHKDLLCGCAEYFRAALKGHFKEACEQKLELPEDKTTVFSRFVVWLYTGNILESKEAIKNVKWDTLIAIYLFGEARGIPRLQNAALDSIILKSKKMEANQQMPTSEINLVWTSTPETSHLRRLLVDMMTYGSGSSDPLWLSKEYEDCYPKSFLLDLAISQHAAIVGKKTPIDFENVKSKYWVPVETPKPSSDGTEVAVRGDCNVA